MRTFLTFGIAAGLLVPGAGAVDYEGDVFPIFEEKCGKCHMDGKDKGSVRLDLDRIKGEIGMTVKPNDPVEKSIIYDVVTTKEDIQMPPKGKGSPLTSREIRIVKDWIESGASIAGEAVVVAGGGGGSVGPARPAEPEPLSGQWENNKGQIITATLLRVSGETAILKIADGREVPYPIANLSEESQAKVRAFEGGVAEAGSGRREEGEEEREMEDEDDD